MTEPKRAFAIYRFPRQLPDLYVVRSWTLSPDASPQQGDQLLAKSLAEARACIPDGLTCVFRHEEDDPVLVETWL